MMLGPAFSAAKQAREIIEEEERKKKMRGMMKKRNSLKSKDSTSAAATSTQFRRSLKSNESTAVAAADEVRRAFERSLSGVSERSLKSKKDKKKKKRSLSSFFRIRKSKSKDEDCDDLINGQEKRMSLDSTSFGKISKDTFGMGKIPSTIRYYSDDDYNDPFPSDDAFGQEERIEQYNYHQSNHETRSKDTDPSTQEVASGGASKRDLQQQRAGRLSPTPPSHHQRLHPHNSSFESAPDIELLSEPTSGVAVSSLLPVSPGFYVPSDCGNIPADVVLMGDSQMMTNTTRHESNNSHERSYEESQQRQQLSNSRHSVGGGLVAASGGGSGALVTFCRWQGERNISTTLQIKPEDQNMAELVKRLQARKISSGVLTFSKDELTQIKSGKRRITFVMPQVGNAKFSREEFGEMTADEISKLTKERPIVVEIETEETIDGESFDIF